MSHTVQIFHNKALPIGFLVSSQLILFETVRTCPVRDPGFQNQGSLVFKEITPFSLTCIPCCWSCLGSGTFRILSFFQSHPISSSPAIWTDFFPCLRLLLGKSGMALQTQKKKKQRSFANALFFFQPKQHVCVCVYLQHVCDRPRSYRWWCSRS